MASRATAEKWLAELTRLPTASGHEDYVAAWVAKWVARRADLTVESDSGGNILVTQKGRKRHPLVLAVAHMDHPAFVVSDVSSASASFEFRGGVNAVYFEDARVEFHRSGQTMVVASYDPVLKTGVIQPISGPMITVVPGDIGMWVFSPEPASAGLFQAPACDDLAGIAASLAALDIARNRPGLRHYGVLLTRAEEVGLVGALHAAKHQTVPVDSRMISIETSRELPNARLGDGPIIRTGDRSTVFDRELTNRISHAAAASRIKHQRKLMDGGGCEATAFGSFGYQATGLCVALRNWHNRGNLDAVEAGSGDAVPMLEEISLADFHGLIELIVLSAAAVDDPDILRDRLELLYTTESGVLGRAIQ